MSSQNKAIQATIGGKVDNENTNLLDKFFEIPAYQRLYEWESTQIEELLNDMKKARDEGKGQYFIGNITTSKKGDSFVLIDGQQRLTTLWFIGFYLASKGCDKWKEFILQNDKLRIAMPIRENEEKALKDLANNIAGKENLAQSLLGKDIYQNIFEAFKCIESWLVSGNGKDIDLAKFAKYIYESVCFVFVELAQTDLNRFFVRMNNRGKQLEKHEILKARILDKIKDDKDWQKYAKIWDLCSDMNKYIFQSANDRKILNPKAKNDKKDNNKDETENDRTKNDKLVHLAEIADEYTIIKDNKKVKDNGAHSGAESIIDFPTFLLHCYKLWVVKKCNENEIPKEITIAKDRLLEIMWDAKEDKDRHDYLFIKSDKQDCKDFIVDMLYYRVLFDYFVIKNTLSDDGFAIMQLYENKGAYQAKSKVFTQLTMIQNYLRVARQGERQNYHHWLTPFLKFLDNQICLEMDLSLMKNCEFDFTNFECGAKKIAEQFSKDECDGRQKVLVRFLENLDTKLAIKQLSKTNENVLLNIANTILININEHLNFQEEKSKIEQISKWREKYKNIFFYKKCFLNNGTNTPHYWFYRLEYYLWKWGKYKPKKLGSFCKKLDDYNFDLKAKNCVLNSNYFHFRMLGSIEHFSAIQRKDKREKEWNLDIFGNLALISQNFNSSLSNQLEQFKKDEVIKQLKRGRLESLKYFIMCANLNGDEWTENDAQAHQEQMLDILIESLKDSQGK